MPYLYRHYSKERGTNITVCFINSHIFVVFNKPELISLSIRNQLVATSSYPLRALIEWKMACENMTLEKIENTQYKEQIEKIDERLMIWNLYGSSIY